ncbi:hypothetical protein T09_12000 [Trichinella sp. T9]|nr:hypothetical protein T09_12000 [Trichinella sp. T9]KRZ92571.1 hypothetical protein T08_11136 [Trichinella sp. T8]
MTEALESLVITCIAERSVSISVVNDILVTLKKGRTFAKFDLVQTYHQLPVDKLRLHNAQKNL